MNVEKLRLQKIIFECHKHIEKLNTAYQKLERLLPLTESSYLNFDEDQTSYLDQFLYRFSKLQDSIGQKLFKAVLDFKKEDTTAKSFIDMLNRLEQLEYLQDIDGWFELRTIRNQLAHDYEDDSEELVAIINKIFSQKTKLENYFFTVIQKLGAF
ncbi:MAG: hypothetical protein PHQ03_03715 [Methylococcales bacterium]|nr:hypothetical protein [Methylococcales bacterium]